MTCNIKSIQIFPTTECELCISTYPFPDETYINTKIFTEKVYLGIPPSHSLYTATQISMNDISVHKFAMFLDDFKIHFDFIQSFEKLGYSPQIAISSGAYNTIKEVSQSNNLLFITAEHSLNSNDGFRYYPYPDDSITWDLWILMKKNMKNNHARILYDYMVEHTKGL